MTAVHPYIRWDGGSTSVRASVGAGDGSNARADGATGTSPASLRLGIVELGKRLGAPGGIDLALVGDAAWARLRTGEGDEAIDRQDIDVSQARIDVDLSLPARLGGLELTPFGTMHARRGGGSIYLHCDPTASHYLKTLMDAIFGAEQFRNEIVWCYTGPGNPVRWFPRRSRSKITLAGALGSLSSITPIEPL